MWNRWEFGFGCIAASIVSAEAIAAADPASQLTALERSPDRPSHRRTFRDVLDLQMAPGSGGPGAQRTQFDHARCAHLLYGRRSAAAFARHTRPSFRRGLEHRNIVP